MMKKYHIAVFLAAVFLIAGWHASRSYNTYRINIKKLDILRTQERYLKQRITTFEEKKNVLTQVADFTGRASQLGLTPGQWDSFGVDLQNVAMSFADLQGLLDQADSGQAYYFIPRLLWVRVAGIPSVFKTKGAAGKNSNGMPEDQTAPNPSSAGEDGDSDTVISLEGRFLVRHHRRDHG